MLTAKNNHFLGALQGNQGETAPINPRAEEFKRRMLTWPNPVEFVNNMYGCHPDHGKGENDYFQIVFAR